MALRRDRFNGRHHANPTIQRLFLWVKMRLSYYTLNRESRNVP